MLIGAALVGLFFLVFAGGSADPAGKILDQMGRRISEAVKDKPRRKEAEGVVGDIRTYRRGAVGRVETLLEELTRAHAGHETPRAEAEKILEDLDSLRKESWGKQIDARFKLHDILSREEWVQVFPPPRKS